MMPEYVEQRISNLVEKYADKISASHYIDEAVTPAKHCLLGWMAVEAEIKLPPRRYNTHSIGMRGTLRFADDLQLEYGLSLDQLRQLQSINDDAKGPEELFEKVHQLLADWKKSERVAA